MLPIPVETKKLKRTYRNGVLEIHFQKARAVKPKEVKIEVVCEHVVQPLNFQQ